MTANGSFNCMTHALKLEGKIQSRPKDLDWMKEPEEAIAELAKMYGREVRDISSLDDEIHEGEWIICFFGWIYPDPDDYSCNMFDIADYHFLLQNEDGTWSQRKTWDAPVEICDVEKYIAMYGRYGYSPKYFAVRRVEE